MGVEGAWISTDVFIRKNLCGYNSFRMQGILSLEMHVSCPAIEHCYSEQVYILPLNMDTQQTKE